MAARRSQRRRGRRGEPGTALLAPLVLSLGLALACLGLLLVVVSLGSWATLSAQQAPSQEELTAEDRREPPELNPQTEESQDVVPFLEQLVRPRRSAPKGQKARPRRAIAAHYEVHPRPGQDGAQAGVDGTVSGWEETKINSSSPLRYDRQIGEFTVIRAGLYYLYCQVHFDEGKAVYLKLDLLVNGVLALRCLEEFSATAASSPGPQLRLCQSPDALEAWKDGVRSRRRRAILTQKHKKKHSVLHLVPINITSKDSDVTEVMWQPVLRRGRGLEAQGDIVRVWDTGIYLLYSQVLFHDVTFTMGQVVSREGQGRRETLFRCIRSMPSDPDRAYNSCYSAGVFHLHQGDIITVKIPRANAKLSLSPHGTFLGFVKL
ncbi:tumor necrosis factor ligand superfamily member 12 isoform X3 [Mus pahari]|uniref:tumor necrosis factor ligand superfamily member 12 isoform X3 n=1 Tax=Mus pahari TaxID=10093 RepID=UPI001114C45E|nr:tumor necrosis factor ligand superfamily member 12 isoform X3 [Mus pahari]